MKRSRIFLIIGGLCLLAAGFCGVRIWQGSYAPEPAPYAEAPPTPAPLPSPTPSPPPAIAPEAAPAAPSAEPAESPYVSPIDFDALRARNPDIYGWLEIAGTNISYPIVQSAVDDAFYLNHNSDGAYSANGAIFSESAYNSDDFSDPVTILYGHHMSSGAMFGDLQRYYTDSAFFGQDTPITVYTPDARLDFGVFAAVPYPSDHILYYNDFSEEGVFASFFESIQNIRDLNAHFNETHNPDPDDPVLILSTCLAGNNTQRFLVMATLLETPYTVN